MIRIPCGHCRGTGKIDLPLELAETVAAMHGLSRAPELARRLGCMGTAMCNRLGKLEELGLVECVGKRGKAKLWRKVARETGKNPRKAGDRA